MAIAMLRRIGTPARAAAPAPGARATAGEAAPPVAPADIVCIVTNRHGRMPRRCRGRQA